MGYIVNDFSNRIGYINASGQIFDTSGHHIASINDSGYIIQPGGYNCYGKICEDGTITDTMYNAIGNIQANGYVYIGSRRVGCVDSEFIKEITPKAWNYGHPGEYPNAPSKSYTYPQKTSHHSWPFGPSTTFKLILGVVLGIAAIVTAGGDLGLSGCLLAIPTMIVIVFMFPILFKLFIH